MSRAGRGAAEAEANLKVMVSVRGADQKCTIDVPKKTTAEEIKALLLAEWGFPPKEQTLMFRGIISEGDAQPFNIQDLHKMVGEGPLEVWLVHRKLRLPPFLKEQGLKGGNSKTKFGSTALHRAVIRCELGVMEELLNTPEFTQTDTQDKAGRTALHSGVICRFEEPCMMLLESPRFTALNAVDKEKRTALHYAALWGDPALPVLKALLEHEGFTSKHVEDSSGRTALVYAEERSFEALCELLREGDLAQPASKAPELREEDGAQDIWAPEPDPTAQSEPLSQE